MQISSPVVTNSAKKIVEGARAMPAVPDIMASFRFGMDLERQRAELAVALYPFQLSDPVPSVPTAKDVTTTGPVNNWAKAVGPRRPMARRASKHLLSTESTRSWMVGISDCHRLRLR